MKPILLKVSYVVMCVVMTALAFRLGYAFIGRMIHWWELAGIADWSIFVDFGSRYIQSGRLYEQNIILYGPGEPVYKFPPLFASVIVFCMQHGMSAESLKFWNSTLHIALYFFTTALLLFGIKRKNNFLLYPCVVFYLLNSEAFFDNYLRLQLEIYVVFLISLGVIFLVQKKYFWSGFFLGFATGLKIYPAFFCVAFLLRRDYRTLVGLSAGFVTTLVISLITINFDDHLFYFTRVVPFMLSEGIYATRENISISYFMVLLGFPLTQAAFVAKGSQILAILVVVFGVVVDHYRKSFSEDGQEDGALKIACGFSILISGFVFGTQNSWWNYQLLLMIPIIVIMIICLDRRYLNWFGVLATIAAILFMYYGSVEHLSTINALSVNWFGDANFLQAIFVHSVYPRTIGSLLIYLVSMHFYWILFKKQIQQMVRPSRVAQNGHS